MARMSIDDMFLRDTRVLRLARELSMSKFETIGRLLAVIAVVYDRVESVLDPADIDIAAELDGFASAMIRVGLAENKRGAVRVRGAEERIKYLQTRAESGRDGGLKSAEVRRNRSKQESKVTFNGPSRSPSDESKQTFEKSEAPPNPPVPDSASAPPPVVVPPPALVLERAHAPVARISKPLRKSVQIPEDWQPADFAQLDSRDRLELERFRNYHRSKGNAFKDAGLAWLNWLSRSADFAPRPTANSNPTGVALAELHRLEREAAARGEA